MNSKSFLVAGAALIVLSACADGNYRPYRLDDNFGKTQRHMVNAQIADPEAAAHPPADSPRKTDGYAGVNTMRTFRDAFGQENQTQGLTINIGNPGAGSGSQ
ncbi:MAG: hypothetical protein ACU841_05020 [Gammaproteobacteria bacterium]